jgi:ribosomal-protein-serine acetyltransferase
MDFHLCHGLVLLRRYRDGNVSDIYQAVRESIPALSPWFAWCNETFSIQEAERFLKNQSVWWEAGEVYNFATSDQTTDTYCGGCLLNNINRGDRFANLAYWVRSTFTDRGIATAAAEMVAAFGFDHLGLNRVEIVVAKPNSASIRVAEKTGAQPEGELRRRITVRDQVYDAVLFSLIPEGLQRQSWDDHRSNRDQDWQSPI